MKKEKGAKERRKSNKQQIWAEKTGQGKATGWGGGGEEIKGKEDKRV